MNLLQRFAHRFFGWHFVAYRYGFGETDICRVRQMPNGRTYVLWCGRPRFFDEEPQRFQPLTWTEEASA